MPTGTLVVGAGLLIAGLSAYGFVAVASRALSKAEYAPLNALWGLLFLLGPGLFIPLEQEVSRALAERRCRHEGGAPIVRRAATVGVGLGLVVLVILIATAKLSVDHLFDGQLLLLVGLTLGLVGALAGHLTRGSMSGTSHFRGYGAYIGAEGVIRVLGCGACALLGFKTAGPFGIALGIAGLLAVPVALRVERPRLGPGPEAAWAEVSTSLGWLLGASLCAFAIMNLGPVLVQLFASDGQKDLAGQFLPGLVVARVPLFLFTAIQAALLPKLTNLATSGRLGHFRVGLKRLLVVVAGLAAVGTVGGWIMGPMVVKIMSGPEYQLSHRTMGLLAAGSGFFMLAQALAQALIALGRQAEQMVAWFIGLVTLFPTALLVSDDLYFRVEIGLLVASVVAFLAMGALLIRRLLEAGPGELEVDSGDFIEALHDVALEP